MKIFKRKRFTAEEVIKVWVQNNFGIFSVFIFYFWGDEFFDS